MKTSELTGPALDWAVATAEKMSWWTLRTAKWDQNDGYTDWVLDRDGVLKKFWFDGSRSRAGHWEEQEKFQPSTDWAQGGPIKTAARIGTLPNKDGNGWEAGTAWEFFESESFAYHRSNGETELIAVMRCFVASKLGDEVDVPEELIS